MSTLAYQIYFLLACLYLVCCIGCMGQNPDEIQHVFCDAEKVIGNKFICEGDAFYHGNLQTDKIAFSGKHSVMLQKGRQYGMSYHFDNVNEGERFIVRVKRYGKKNVGALVLAGTNIQLCHFATEEPTGEKSDDGWNMLELKATIPYGVDSVKVYLSCDSDEPVYFDDLEIIHLKKVNLEYPEHPKLKLFLDSLDLAQMTQLRETALKGLILDDKCKKEFNCTISYNNKHLQGTIRFKGDWTDHLKTSKWSFRIELEGNQTIMGKRTFSIQHPQTRGFAKEWLLHKLLMREGVLTTMYEFIPVEQNGKSMGLYAFEEHFEKQLLESQKRREGVILKFDEEMFWKSMMVRNREKIHHYFPTFKLSFFKPFNRKKVLKTNSLKKQLILGNNLFEMYRSMHPSVEQYLDVDLYAKYLAIMTLTNTTGHSANWHNQRWYVNPVTARLEPVGFDFSDSFEDSPEKNKVFTMLMEMNQEKPEDLTVYTHAFIFKNQYFKDRYLNNLNRMIQPGYMDSVFEDLSSEFDEVDLLLDQEFPEQKIKREILSENIANIKEQLPDFVAWLDKGLPQVHPDTSNKRTNIHPIISAKIPVLVYEQAKGSYVVENNGGHDVVVYAYRSKESKDTVFLNTETVVGVSHWLRNRSVVNITEKASAFYYRISGNNHEGKASIFNWPVPKSYTPRQSMIRNADMQRPEVLVKKKDHYRIQKGRHEVNELIYIPSNSKLIVEAGTELVFGNNGGILSESPIIMKGTENEPIAILSESDKSQGLTVLQANAASTLNHVRFSSMNNFSLEGWTLSGGVNFY